MGLIVEIIALICNAFRSNYRSVCDMLSSEKKEGETSEGDKDKLWWGARIKGWFGGYKDNWDKHYDSDDNSEVKDS